jgi:hypothetical protein
MPDLHNQQQFEEFKGEQNVAAVGGNVSSFDDDLWNQLAAIQSFNKRGISALSAFYNFMKQYCKTL